MGDWRVWLQVVWPLLALVFALLRRRRNPQPTLPAPQYDESRVHDEAMQRGVWRRRAALAMVIGFPAAVAVFGVASWLTRGGDGLLH